jgi:hypothetical protein
MSIELTLDRMSQSAAKFHLRLVVTNTESCRILLPYPHITGLQFGDETGTNAQWYTSLLVSSSWSGLVLDPGESKAVTFSVRPESAPRPRRDEGEDYYRWCVGIRSGLYTVRYSMVTDADYFDGDSHYRLPEVQEEAQKLSAVAWTGRAQSNAITIEHAEPGAPPNGGPAERFGNSGISGGPPSVS